VKFRGSSIIFDVTIKEFDEPFQPTPPTSIFTVDRGELTKAVAIVKEELRVFAQRLQKINEESDLNIKGIDNVLIWYDANY
jgi:hypothetical protein